MIRRNAIAFWIIIGLLAGVWQLLGGCEKEVHIKLNTGPAQLVVEGGIESNLPPYVLLTRSIGFLSKIDLGTLQNSFVHDAVVNVSDGTRTIRLKEYTLDTGSSGNKFYIYTIDTADAVSRSFTGRVNGYYELNITVDGKTYTSVAKIPEVKVLDSLWALPPEYTDDKAPDARIVYFRYTDPDTFGNCIRYFTKRNSQPYYPGFGGSVVDDELFNGTQVSSYFRAGYDNSKEPNRDSLGRFFKGDTVTIKWCAIDRGVYNFWNTFEFAAGSYGSPFSSPLNAQSNVSNGALGVWSGYGTSFRTLIISR